MIPIVPCDTEFKKELVINLTKNLSKNKQSIKVFENILRHRSISNFHKPAAYLVFGAWQYKTDSTNRINAPSIKIIEDQIKNLSSTINNLIQQLRILTDESKNILTSFGEADPEKFVIAWNSLAGPAVEREVPGAWNTEIEKQIGQLLNIKNIADIAFLSMKSSELINNANNGSKNYYETIQFRPPAYELALWVLRAITLAGQDRKYLEPITGAIHAWVSGRPTSKKWNERGFREARMLIPDDPHTP